MPRTARASVGGVCYQVLNRGNARRQVFRKAEDYHAFLKAVGHACIEIPLRILGYCLMPTQFHLCRQPVHEGDLSRWLHWLLNTRVRRYHQHYHSSGLIGQGRFQAFPIAEDEHLLTVLRYGDRDYLKLQVSDLTVFSSNQRSPFAAIPTDRRRKNFSPRMSQIEWWSVLGIEVR